MARSFSLDTEAAKQANSGGKRITDSGKYVGKITAAWSESYQSGAEAVLLKFESDQGQEAGPLMMFTHGKDGNTLSGFNMVQAIMTCVQARSLNPQPGKVELYDFDQSKEVVKDKDIYPELTGKRIGLLLREEQYTDRDGFLKMRDDGTPKTRMIIFAPFCAQTERVATEILERASTPTGLPNMVQWLASNPVKEVKNAKREQSGGQYTGGPNDYSNSYVPPADDLDDSIPFN